MHACAPAPDGRALQHGALVGQPASLLLEQLASFYADDSHVADADIELLRLLMAKWGSKVPLSSEWH